MNIGGVVKQVERKSGSITDEPSVEMVAIKDSNVIEAKDIAKIEPVEDAIVSQPETHSNVKGTTSHVSLVLTPETHIIPNSQAEYSQSSKSGSSQSAQPQLLQNNQVTLQQNPQQSMALTQPQIFQNMTVQKAKIPLPSQDHNISDSISPKSHIIKNILKLITTEHLAPFSSMPQKNQPHQLLSTMFQENINRIQRQPIRLELEPQSLKNSRQVRLDSISQKSVELSHQWLDQLPKIEQQPTQPVIEQEHGRNRLQNLIRKQWRNPQHNISPQQWGNPLFNAPHQTLPRPKVSQENFSPSNFSPQWNNRRFNFASQGNNPRFNIASQINNRGSNSLQQNNLHPTILHQYKVRPNILQQYPPNQNLQQPNNVRQHLLQLNTLRRDVVKPNNPQQQNVSRQNDHHQKFSQQNN